MEIVPGETLAERIASGPVPLREPLRIARQIADALDAAHERGIVHRDQPPASNRLSPASASFWGWGSHAVDTESKCDNNCGQFLSACVGHVYIHGAAMVASPWYAQILTTPLIAMSMLGASRWRRLGTFLAASLVLAATYAAKLIPLYGGYEGRTSCLHLRVSTRIGCNRYRLISIRYRSRGHRSSAFWPALLCY